MDTAPPLPSPPSVPSVAAQGWPEEKVFLALTNAQRRHLLKRLGANPLGFTAREAGGGGTPHYHLMLKHLLVLEELGVVTSATDAKDARCRRYRLAPGVVVRRAGPDWEMDFGCGVLRWLAGSETQPSPPPLYRNRRQRR